MCGERLDSPCLQWGGSGSVSIVSPCLDWCCFSGTLGNCVVSVARKNKYTVYQSYVQAASDWTRNRISMKKRLGIYDSISYYATILQPSLLILQINTTVRH